MSTPATEPLVQLADLNVDLAGRRILHDLNWRLPRGEHWALVGPNGSGKSSLLRLIRGELVPRSGGRRTWHLNGHTTASAIVARERIALVSAEAQNRYGRDTWGQSVRDAVAAGLRGERFLYGDITTDEAARVEEVVARVDLSDLAERRPGTLSQGELRRMMIAQALVSRPEVLLLDEITSGLDAASRDRLRELLDDLSTDVTLVCAAHRPEDLPSCVGRAARLQDGRIIWTGPAAELSLRRRQAAMTRPAAVAEPLVEIRGADLIVDGQTLLHDLTWTIHAGEHWRVVGPNGAGKSTLLRLLYADLRPALGGSITWFGRPGLVPVWDIRAGIGYVTDRVQIEYDGSETVEDVVGSGFRHGVGLFQPLTPPQRERVAAAMVDWRLEPLRGRRFGHLSQGQARRVLLARALVHRPRLLLLDEALDGLDPAAADELGERLAGLAAEGLTLVQVTHHDADRVPVAHRVLRLDRGRAVIDR